MVSLITVAPRTERKTIQDLLTRIWQEVFSAKGIGPDDDFFELGGGPVEALLVCDRVEKASGCEMTPATFLEAPTIETWTSLLLDALLPNHHPEFPLPLSLARPPLFCLHAMSASALACVDLARSLARKHRVISVFPRGSERDVSDLTASWPQAWPPRNPRRQNTKLMLT